jgi:hypothetical protein
MQAMHGLAVPFRRLAIGCVFAVVLVFAAAFASSASAVTVTHSDLALGDSLAFGYSQQLFNENEKLGEPPTAFNHGYANYYFNQSKAKALGSQLINNGCPGETTDSMIGNGALAAAFEIEGESPCAYHKTGFPLHSEYGVEKSQLESTIETLAVDAGTGKPVTHVTLNIGANDELHAIAKCEAEVKNEFETKGESQYGTTPEKAVNGCIVAHVPGLFEHIITNIGRIDTAIREGSKFGGINYAGPIIFQAGYDPYGDLCGPALAKTSPTHPEGTQPMKGVLPLPEETCRAVFKE